MFFYPMKLGGEVWGSTLTPTWNVTEQTSASGKRRAVSEQLYPHWQFKLSYKGLSDADVNTLLGFYNARKGSFEPFYYKDYSHHKVEKAVLTKNSNGVYPLLADIGGSLEPVSYVDNLVVYVNDKVNTKYTLNKDAITISTTGTVKASFDYYFLVHFASTISITQVFDNVNNVSVTLESVR